MKAIRILYRLSGNTKAIRLYGTSKTLSIELPVYRHSKEIRRTAVSSKGDFIGDQSVPNLAPWRFA
jgi:hypothetical protein